MLTQIDLVSENEVQLPILGITPKNSLLIKKITGLNPPDKSLFIGDYSQDGGIYQGRRVGNRNIVITIDLNPNPALDETVSKLRQNLYKAFNDPQVDGDYLKIRLHEDDGSVKYIVGYCEKFESEIFESETMCQISLICPDPYIRDDADTILYQPTGWVSFPYEYQGTAETGFDVRIYVTTPTSKVTLENNGKFLRLVNNANPYEVDDLIMINTTRGQRSITLTKPADITVTPTEFATGVSYAVGTMVFWGGSVWAAVNPLLAEGSTIDMAPSVTTKFWSQVSTPIIGDLTSNSHWLELHSVSNTMKVFGDILTRDIVANVKYLKYTSAYWGM